MTFNRYNKQISVVILKSLSEYLNNDVRHLYSNSDYSTTLYGTLNSSTVFKFASNKSIVQKLNFADTSKIATVSNRKIIFLKCTLNEKVASTLNP